MGQMSHHVMLQRKNIKYLTADFLYWGKILFFFVNGDLCMFVGVYLYIKNTIYCAWRCRIMGEKSQNLLICFTDVLFYLFSPSHAFFSVSFAFAACWGHFFLRVQIYRYWRTNWRHVGSPVAEVLSGIVGAEIPLPSLLQLSLGGMHGGGEWSK